jgi:Arc/MetJ-type ribon-helix-helix transcriptional regulator
MMRKVQARLDEATKAALDRAVSNLGISRSEVIRRGIMLLDQEKRVSVASRMIGIGILDFGPADIATNKKYLEGFGRNSGIDEQEVQLERKVG